MATAISTSRRPRSRGAFGEVVLGAEDPAVSLMHYGNQDVGVGLNCGDVGAWIDGVAGCSTGGLGTAGWGTGDRKQISYFSPRLAGVQFGATYIPNSDPSAETGNVTPLNNDMDAWSVGLNYKGDLGGSTVAVSFGHYQRSQMGAEEMLKSGMNDDKITVDRYMANLADLEAGAEALTEGVEDGTTLGAVAQAAHAALVSNNGAFDITQSEGRHLSPSRTSACRSASAGSVSMSPSPRWTAAPTWSPRARSRCTPRAMACWTMTTMARPTGCPTPPTTTMPATTPRGRSS